MRLTLAGFFWILAICIELAAANASEHVDEPRPNNGSGPEDECERDTQSLYLELYADGSKRANAGSMYRLLPPGPVKHLFHFQQSKLAGVEAINVPLALGLHRPQRISDPINRSVEASVSQQFLMEEFYVSRFIEFATNNIELPLSNIFMGACIIYTYRSVRNQLGVSSSLPDIHKVATMTFQLPNIKEENFRKLCRQYIVSTWVTGKHVSPLSLVSQMCSQIQFCIDDSTTLNSVIALRETLSTKPETLPIQDSANRVGFINHIKSRFQGKTLNVNLLRLYRLVCRLDSIINTFFPGKLTDAFAIKDQSHMDSWQQIVEYLDENNSGSMTCEDLLRLHLKAFPLFQTQLNTSKRNHLSKLLCASSEPAVNQYLTPSPPASVSFQYLMYLNEYLELPLKLISKSQCVFFLSASYTGMFPRFEHSTELALLLDQFKTKHKTSEEFLPHCMHILPKYINLAENTFVPKERIVINKKRDSSEICSAIYDCFSSGSPLSENDLAALFVSTISSHGSDFYNQFLPRAKFISRSAEKRRVREHRVESKVDSVVESRLLAPISVINAATATHDPGVAIKVQKLYSSLVRVGLLLTGKTHISDVSKAKRPLSLPKEFISEKSIEELVPSVSDLSAIVSNSLVPSDCASDITKRRPELSSVFFTLTSLCEYILNNSYPTPFSDVPYLLKLVTILSDTYGFSINKIKRIHAYASSSYAIFGVQIRLLPLFSFVSRHSSARDNLKSEYNICMESFQFKLFFTSSQIQDKKDSFCRYAALVLEDEFFDRNILFAIKSFSRKSQIEEEWYNSLSNLINDVRKSLASSVGSSLTIGYSIGDGSKFVPFFISKYIRNIQKSNYAGELSNKDIIRIFTRIYYGYEKASDIGSSAFVGNALRYEFISSRDSSKDMSNFKLVSDEIYGLRYVFSHDIVLESYPYLVESCVVVTTEHVKSTVSGELEAEKIREICEQTFSTPNKELPTQHNTNSLYLNYLVNYLSVPQQAISQFQCMYKVISAFSNLPEGIPSFEASANFGLNLYVLTRGFRNVKEATFGDKCKVAALLSNIINTDTDAAIYDEESSSKTNFGRSLHRKNTSPVEARQISAFCNAVIQCSKSNLHDRHVRDFVSNQTLYNFIYDDHLSGDPIASSNIKLGKDGSKEGTSRSQIKHLLEREVEKLIIEGLEITYKGNTVKVQGLRMLESIRLYGVFHDSFRGLLRQLEGEDLVSKYDFSGLYSGASPIKGRNDSIDEMNIFSIETAAYVVHRISVSLSDNDKASEAQSLVISTQRNALYYCNEHLKSVLSDGFDLYEINSICSVAFSAFKY
ncbi:putative signal peptide-containing protein [Cryptosporidium canis]|uniref:Signal peptide-containing protein n=1 Tax=Cryptosporidium canis TaxID=195482 RepID=A0ABQ8P1U9_9CRYT|nr:putative signal peptide-containing protein [Cryptosporidium canis]